MKIVFSKILYRFRNNYKEPKWQHIYPLVVEYDECTYLFTIIVYRFLFFLKEKRLKVRKSISLKKTNYSIKDLNSNLYKPILDKYGYRLKYYRILGEMLEVLRNYYKTEIENLTDIIITSTLIPETVIRKHIIPFLI